MRKTMPAAEKQEWREAESMRRLLVSTSFMHDDFPFWIDKYIHKEESSPSMHEHDFIELVYVVSGTAVHHFEDGSYDIRAGDVFIINPGEQHGYSVPAGGRLEIINCLFKPGLIQDSLLGELGISQSMDYFYVHPFLNRDERFHHRLNLRGRDADRALSLLEGMLWELEKHEPGYTAFIRLQMIELLILLSRCYGKQAQGAGKTSKNELLVRRICGYLERHYHQKITLGTLAELFNISVRQLNRLFKQETGNSVIEHVHRIRIEKAKHMLAETDEKVIVVAAAVGYDDPAFFSRLFTRKVGCSPGKYREGFTDPLEPQTNEEGPATFG